eukprot:s968_g42.t1
MVSLGIVPNSSSPENDFVLFAGFAGPILLLAPVPVRVQVPMGEAEPRRIQKKKPGLDTLLNFRSPRIDRSYRRL